MSRNPKENNIESNILAEARREDRTMFLKLCRDGRETNIGDTDIVEITRLGKKDPAKKRPVLAKLSNSRLKLTLIRNLAKLKA